MNTWSGKSNEEEGEVNTDSEGVEASQGDHAKLLASNP